MTNAISLGVVSVWVCNCRTAVNSLLRRLAVSSTVAGRVRKSIPR